MEAIAPICNFQERIPSELLRYSKSKDTSSSRARMHKHASTLTMTAGQTSEKPGDDRCSSQQHGSAVDVTAIPRVGSQLSKHQDAIQEESVDINKESRAKVGLYKSNLQIAEPSEKNLTSGIQGYDIASSHRNTPFEIASQHSKTSRMKVIQNTWRVLVEKIKDFIEQSTATGQTLEALDIKGPQSVPGYCYYNNQANLEAFLIDKLGQ